jgi:hypothetical protein
VLDVVVNKPFKDHLKRQYSNWLRGSDHTYTPTGRMKKPSVSALCEWVLEARNAMSSDSIIHGFKKSCISSILDGTKDDMLWQTVPGNSKNDTSDEETDIKDVYEDF